MGHTRVLVYEAQTVAKRSRCAYEELSVSKGVYVVIMANDPKTMSSAHSSGRRGVTLLGRGSRSGGVRRAIERFQSEQ